MLYLASCPKCKGDMREDQDMYGTYRQCLKCGSLEDIAQDTPVRLPRLTNANRPYAHSPKV